MCDSAEFELDLLHFIMIGFKSQKELQNINNPHIFAMHNLQKELFRNSHKMSGFLRFVELNEGTLYAKLESKFNLVYLFGSFFLKDSITKTTLFTTLVVSLHLYIRRSLRE